MDCDQRCAMDYRRFRLARHRKRANTRQAHGEYRTRTNRNRDDSDSEVDGDAAGVHARVHLLDFAIESHRRPGLFHRNGLTDDGRRVFVDDSQQRGVAHCHARRVRQWEQCDRVHRFAKRRCGTNGDADDRNSGLHVDSDRSCCGAVNGSRASLQAELNRP